MKLIVAIVQADDAAQIMEALVVAGHRVTRMATTGGWLRRENVTLLSGVTEREVNHVLQILKRTGCQRQADGVDAARFGATHPLVIGRATVFVLDVERFEQY